MELLYALLIILIIICLLAIVYIFYYNRLQDFKLKIDEAEAVLDESLREKYDSIIEIKSLINKVAKNNKINFKDMDKLKTEEISNFDLDRKLNEYMILINQIFNDYNSVNQSDELNGKLIEIDRIDEKITSAKTFYNKYISESNELVRKFPSNVVAKFHNIKIKNFFDNKDLNDDVINDFKL